MVELAELTLCDLLAQAVQLYPHEAAVECDGQLYSWLQLDDWSDSLAKGLIASGVEDGSRVGILCEDTVQSLVYQLAVLKVGGVCVMLNPASTAGEVATLLQSVNVGFAVCTRYCQGKSLLQKLHVGGIADGTIELFATDDIDYDRLVSMKELVVRGEQLDEELRQRRLELTPSHTAYILFTSGTTGVAKAVPSSHFMRANNARVQADDLQLTNSDKLCVAIPMFHCFCLTANIFAAVASGACICFPTSRRTAAIWSALGAGCTVLHGVPTMYLALMASQGYAKERTDTLRIGLVGGATYSKEQFVRIEQAFGMTLLPSLGQTEATAGITVGSVTDTQEVRCSTIGRLMQHLKGKIVDIIDGKPLPSGEVGELCIRGYSVMQGYCNSNNTEPSPIGADGWLHTGDLCFVDADGLLHYAGRLKQLIIRGGENISPSEVEQAIVSCGLPIVEARVVGVPDDHYGEELCACVVTDNGATITVELLQEQLATTLAAYKLPRYCITIDSMPLTASGKVDVAKLRKLAGQQVGGEEGQ